MDINTQSSPESDGFFRSALALVLLTILTVL